MLRRTHASVQTSITDVCAKNAKSSSVKMAVSVLKTRMQSRCANVRMVSRELGVKNHSVPTTAKIK